MYNRPALSEHDHDAADGHKHPPRKNAGSEPPAAAIDRAARIFRAAGDGPRLRLLQRLAGGELCVTELAEDDPLSTVSQRLRVLRMERLVKRRRDGKHIYYSLADDHIADLVQSAIEHAAEDDAGG